MMAENENEPKKNELDKEEAQGNQIKEFGQLTLDENDHKIHLLSIIGEIEGHECLPAHTKTTKYEHVLPQLAAIEDSKDIEGLLILLNTVGGDVEAGLAIGEMVASLSKPSVSLVLGGSHSIGVPLAVSSDYSFIVPSATMIIHPVRMSGTVIGVSQTYDYFEKIQDRILEFIVRNSKITKERLRELMLDTDMLAKDVGSILIGKESVDEGLINQVGGIQDAMNYLYQVIDINREKKKQQEIKDDETKI
jgi:ATP-dependent protease ClpP protease subunit